MEGDMYAGFHGEGSNIERMEMMDERMVERRRQWTRFAFGSGFAAGMIVTTMLVMLVYYFLVWQGGRRLAEASRTPVVVIQR